MNREDCWMSFSEALESYLDARENNQDAPEGCHRWHDNMQQMAEAKLHMDALTAPLPPSDARGQTP